MMWSAGGGALLGAALTYALTRPQAATRFALARGGRGADVASSGDRQRSNAAFEEYRAAALQRLDQDADEFEAYLARLRLAKDRAEFERFMAERRGKDAVGVDVRPPS
jgi:hypothetical protein